MIYIEHDHVHEGKTLSVTHYMGQLIVHTHTMRKTDQQNKYSDKRLWPEIPVTQTSITSFPHDNAINISLLKLIMPITCRSTALQDNNPGGL